MLRLIIMLPISILWMIFVVEVPVWWLRVIVTLVYLSLWRPTARYSPKAPKQMTGLTFEHYCADLLAKKGFRKVVVTPPSGDYGADIVAVDSKGEKWVFQCKYYQGKVNSSAVQEIVTAKAHYGASKAAVMTNASLTEPARRLALENEVQLFERLIV